MENTDYFFYFKNIPDETALTEALKDVQFPVSVEIRQGEKVERSKEALIKALPEGVAPYSCTARFNSYPVQEILDANSLYELNALLENGKADGWLKDMPVTMICEEWEEEDLGPEPSLSAAERNPSMVGK
jgi:hypothetical protein